MIHFKPLITTSLLLAQVVPNPGPEMSILQYAMTQGGLLTFALILLYYYRRDNLRLQAKDEEKISLLIDLVGSNREAMIKLTAAIESSEIRRHR